MSKNIAGSYDVAVVGGGVIGAAVARELSKLRLSICLLEKDSDVATGTSKANSGIIHAGYSAQADTLKAELNVKANPLFDRLCSDLKVPFERKGSLVVGFNEEDREDLLKKKREGESRGISGLEVLSQEELRERESEISPRAEAALYAPTAGVVSPYKLTIALAENAALNGADIFLNTEVTDILIEDGCIAGVETERGSISTEVVINAAGLYADEIAAMAGEDYTITPRKGEYQLYDKEYGDFVDHVIFPMPDEKSKGILVTPTVAGNLLLGPNSREVDSKEEVSVSEEGLEEIMQGGRKLFPDFPTDGVISTFAGLRAALPHGDFKIEPLDDVPGFIDVAGIQSPGLSCAPAIARLVKDILEDINTELPGPLDLRERDDFNPELPSKPHLRDYAGCREKWQNYFQENEDYGEVICRCEHVTKGEIIDALNRPFKAPTLNAIKRRTRAGGGRCQGGFCGPRVAEIIAEELDISPLEVTKSGPGSKILKARVKDLTPDREITLKAGDKDA